MHRPVRPSVPEKPRPPAEVYEGLISAVRALHGAPGSDLSHAQLQVLAEAPQGTVCWHPGERAPLLLLAPWAVQGGATALLDRMSGLVSLLPGPLQKELSGESMVFAVVCGEQHDILASLPEDRRAWPALRGAAIRGWSLDARGHSADNQPRLGPVWRCVTEALAHWQQSLVDAEAVIAAGPRNQVAERLSRRQPAGMGATAWVAATTTILAALSLVWETASAPGLVQMGAAQSLPPWDGRSESYEWARIFSGAWLHTGAASTLVAAAALAFAQPLESAIGPARWLAVWGSAALCGTLLGAIEGHTPGVGAAAGTAGIVMALLTLARRLQIELAPWGGLPTRWLWPGLLLALAANQWMTWSGLGALAAGGAVGAAWGATGAATWGALQNHQSTTPSAKPIPGWRTWLARGAAGLLVLASAVGLAGAWSSFEPWRAASPTGWRRVSLCQTGLTVELPGDLSEPSCTAEGTAIRAEVGNRQSDTLTVSAVATRAPQEMLALPSAALQQRLRLHLEATKSPSVLVHGAKPLVSRDTVTVLLDQSNSRGPLPRIISLRCGQLVDVEVSIAAGAAEPWRAAAARIAASVGAACPQDPTPSAAP